MAQAHDRAVGGVGGDLEAVGQRLRVDHQRVVAGRLQRRGRPSNTPSRRWLTHDVLPCISSGARTTSPPYTWPIAWSPRHTPNTGVPRSANAGISVAQDAGVLGSAGPG